MKILSLQLKNKFLDWDFEEINFSSNLTLLVFLVQEKPKY